MLKSKFFKNNFIFMAGSLVGGFLAYLFNFVVSRQVTVAQFGELQSLTSSLLVFGVFNSALSYFTIRHTSVFAAHKDYEANREFIFYLRKKIFKIALAILAVLMIFSPALADLLHFSSYVGFFVISFATFLSTMTVIYSEVLRGWEKFFWLTIVGILTALVKFASGAILAILFHQTAIVSFSFLLSAVAGWYLAKLWSQKKIFGKSDQENSNNWKGKYFSEMNIRRTAAKILIFSSALILVSNLDVILVKYFASPETAGYYGAFAIVGKIVLWLNLSVVAVMLPGACADGYSGKRPSKKDMASSYGLMAVIALALIAFYYLAPNFTINLFFGKKYIFETQILWLFGLMSFLLSILTFEANLSFAKHDFRVVYFLSATVLAMIAGLAKYHANLQEIILVLSTSFLLGYIAITALNIYSERNIILQKRC